MRSAKMFNFKGSLSFSIDDIIKELERLKYLYSERKDLRIDINLCCNEACIHLSWEDESILDSDGKYLEGTAGNYLQYTESLEYKNIKFDDKGWEIPKGKI